MTCACDLNRRAVLIAAIPLLAGCQDFETYNVLRSRDGAYAIMARNSFEGGTGDATAICLSNNLAHRCSRANAAVFIYRAADVTVAWQDDQLMINVLGGEVWHREAVVDVKGEDGTERRVQINLVSA